MARPRISIHWEEFDKLCAMQATQEEIASWFRCSVDTIERAIKREWRVGFAEYYAQKATPGKISLRRKQWDMALKGDRTMLIWLGKQHLKQSEKVHQSIEHSGSMSHQLQNMTPEQKLAEIAELEKRALPNHK
jgi:hypothetical protein